MTTHLTDTQKQTIRIALAKWEGWREGPMTWWRDPVNGESATLNDLPNYPASLDACHAIEVKLTDEEHAAFTAWLLVGAKGARTISASAENRALALFRALNLGELGD